LLAARPYRSVIPTGYDGGTAAPLVVLLHGYSVTGANQDLYFGFSALAQSKTFLLATPDGTIDSNAQHFWNATDACCDLNGTGVDDVKYLTAVLDDMTLKYKVDPKRVFFVGHSNGAFMSHRMACERASRIAAIVSLAGAVWKDTSKCTPSEPVNILQVHGTADATIAFNGGAIGGHTYPGAQETVGDWKDFNGCTGALTAFGTAMDIDTNIFGSETTRSHYTCTNGASELWTMTGSGHIPGLGPSWGAAVWDFLSTHPKP
jgi:polyhydroxybutyrate depolymerase